MSETLQRLLSERPLTTDAWVQCDSCQVWRRVPQLVAERLGENHAWFCHQNLDQKFSTCDDPQELEDHEIDVLMQAQEAAANAKARGSGRDGGSRPRVKTHEWYRIERNVFAHRAPKTQTEDDIMVCSCVVEDGVGCGAECLNRLVLSECDPMHCPCGSACGNQRLSRREYKRATVKRTGKKGHGLFAEQDVGAGEFVMEYLGEVLHEDAYHERKERYQEEGRSHYYFMTLSSSETIDATVRGNVARFLNHSCAPNCETQKWMVRGELCIGIFATRDIAAGEELTIDYKFERFGEKPSRCYCMASACCGWIGGAKAAEAAKMYNIDGDEDDEGHEADLEPVMHELDEAKIQEEEARGREAMKDHYTPKKTVVKAENKSWRPPEEIRALERQRKADERTENRAARSSGARSNVRRVKPPAGSYASKWSAMAADAKKRSEVDLRMEELQSTTGGLRSKEAIAQCVQLFNLCYPIDADGKTQVSTRDLGLILEAVSLTMNPNLQAEIVHSGMMACFQKCITTLGGPRASAAHAALIRKILKILSELMLHFKDVIVARIMEMRTAGNVYMKDVLGDLRVANDTPLMKLARDFEVKYVGFGKLGELPDRPSPQQQPTQGHQMHRTGSGSGSGGNWGMRTGSSGALNRFGGAPGRSMFNSGAPRGSAMSGGRGGFNASAPPRSAMSNGGGYGARGGPQYARGGHAPPQPQQSSLAQVMRPQSHAAYPPQRPGGWGPPAGEPSAYDSSRGMKREREEPPRAPQRPASKPLLTKPLPPQFEDPMSELFSDAVTAFVTMEVEDLRVPSNPHHDPRANYDRLTQRWSLEALEAEQKRWSSEHARPLPVGEVRARVSAHVRAAAAQR